jgi:anti-sigma factor RsiW
MTGKNSMCEFEKLVGLYHDDELDELRTAGMREHLLECPVCAGHLADLRRISGCLGTIPLDGISGIERARMFRVADSLPMSLAERAMIRMGAGLAAIAASLLIVTSLWLVGAGGSAARGQVISTPPAEDKALAVADNLDLPRMDAASQDQANSNLSHWMVRNLGGDLP